MLSAKELNSEIGQDKFVESWNHVKIMLDLGDFHNVKLMLVDIISRMPEDEKELLKKLLKVIVDDMIESVDRNIGYFDQNGHYIYME